MSNAAPASGSGALPGEQPRRNSNVVLDLFPTAMRLVDYALLVTGQSDAVLRIMNNEGENMRLKDLCRNALVVPEAEPPLNIPVHAYTGSPSAGAVQSILNRLITQVVKSKTSYRDQNCLALGYRAKGDHTNAGIRGNMDVECYYVNTIHSLLSTMPWQLLAVRLGDAFLLHLLTRPVFVAAQNGCYMQVAGTSVGQLLYRGAAVQSVHARIFFVLRRESRARADSLLKRQKPNDAMRSGTVDGAEETLDALQVRGSTQLPRFDMFYKSRDRKMERFLADAANLSGRTLLLEVYGQVRSFLCADTSQRLVNSTAPESPQLLLELQRPLIAVVNRYRRLDVLKTLQKHCAKKQAEHDSQHDQQDERADAPAHKKVRRGCRAGNSAKYKQKSKLAEIFTDDDNALPRVEACHMRGSVSEKKSSAEVEAGSNSVGQRIFRRIVRVARQGLAQEDEGYISQEAEPSATQMNAVHADSNDMYISLAASEFQYSGASASSSEIPNSDSNSSRLHSVMLSASTQESGCAFNIDRSHATSASVESSGSSNTPVLPESRPTGVTRKRKFVKDLASGNGTDLINNRVGGEDMQPPVGGVDFIEMCTPERDISEFVKSVIRQCFTISEVWGSRHNLNCMLQSIDKYLRLCRNETFTVAQMCNKLQVADFPWLRAVVHSSDTDDLQLGKNRKPPFMLGAAAYSHAKQILLHAFVYWLIADFIHPLLCTYLYATEAEGRGNQVLWYRKSAWAQIVRAGLAQIQPHFVKIMPWASDTSPNARTPDRRGMLSKTPANIRFLPKRTSVRAITNLRSRPNMTEKNAQSSMYAQDAGSVSNTALYNCLHVLKRLFSSQPGLAGFGTFGIDDIYERLKYFRLMIESRRNTCETSQRIVPAQIKSIEQPQFYVAVMDLEKCYDNVDTAQLFNLVRDLIEKQPFQEDAENEGCVLHRYTVAHRIASMERALAKSVRHVSTTGDIFSFEEAVSEISLHYRNSIIADGVVHPKMTKHEMLRLLRLHLFSHVVRMPSRSDSLGRENLHPASRTRNHPQSNQFTQIKGIPQGSVLSPLLCNLYYGHAEQQIFGTEGGIEILGLADRTLVLRMMDDYIIISTDKVACNYFLQRSHIALRPFGGGVNPLKTRVNYDASVELGGRRISLQRIEGRNMPWCGFLVDTHTLEIKPCMKRMLERPLRFATNIESGQAGLVLRRVMKSFVRTKCHAIVLDSTLNSYTTVSRSVYTLFLVAAMRTHVCVRAMQSFSVAKNSTYIVQCIIEAVFFGARLIHSRTSKRSNREIIFGADSEDTEFVQNDDDANTKNAYLRVHNIIGVRNSDAPGRCDVSHRQAVWLGFRAFITVLSKRNGLYNKVVKAIRNKLILLEHVMKTDMLFADPSCLEECDKILEDSIWM